MSESESEKILRKIFVNDEKDLEIKYLISGYLIKDEELEKAE